MSLSVNILMVILAVLGYAIAPVVLVWGWLRWAARPKPKAWSSILSLGSFVLASGSGLLAFATMLYAHVRPFPFYDPTLMRIYAIGFLLSLGGIVVSITSIWKSSALRWHAPLSSVATLAIWVIAAATE